MVTSVLCLALLSAASLILQEPTDEERLAQSVQQLRDSIGKWAVVTEFLNDDGSIARSVEGTYEFSWVVPDRVVTGQNSIPAMQRSSGILFYINEAKRTIEMVSVGADGRLWIMTGPLGGETRYTQFYPEPDGPNQLRFTRYNVTKDRFESKMERTNDGGATWLPGNHQIFRRVQESPR